MIESKEISALFHLIDDPDEEVFNTVSGKLVSYGKGIIPNLQNLWENTFDRSTQERIELVIRELQFRDLQKDLLSWKEHPDDLLQGILIINKFPNPNADSHAFLREIEQIRRNVWLELNSYLTPMEQISTISGVIFGYYKLQGNEINYKILNNFLLSEVLKSKSGNAISNGILYLIVCRMLDIPVNALNLPKQFILGYFTTEFEYRQPESSSEKLSFYIDPINGQVYTQRDVQSYLKRISLPPDPSYFEPISNKRIVQILIDELAKCYKELREDNKHRELVELSKLLDE